MKGNYRTATAADYRYILLLLNEGEERGVLVRSLGHPEQQPYSLLSISKGPFGLSRDGITGFSNTGEPCCIRITETPLRNIELQRGSSDWFPPEQGGIILLVPQ